MGASIPDLEVRVAVGSACRAHAWHAAVWLERLPAGAGDRRRGRSRCRQRPRSPTSSLPWPARPGTLERLVGAYRVVVPRLVAAYTAHLNHTSAAADVPSPGRCGWC